MIRFMELLIASRTNYLKNLAGTENMSQNEIDKKRADMIREILTTADVRQE